jgi:hypothetical protein
LALSFQAKDGSRAGEGTVREREKIVKSVRDLAGFGDGEVPIQGQEQNIRGKKIIILMFPFPSFFQPYTLSSKSFNMAKYVLSV